MANLDLKTLDQENLIELSINKLSNFDAEIAVIGCLLWDNRTYDKISDFLNEEHFSNENNKKIYKIIKKLLDQNALVTPITLKNYLEKNNDDDLDNLTEYISKSGTKISSKRDFIRHITKKHSYITEKRF